MRRTAQAEDRTPLRWKRLHGSWRADIALRIRELEGRLSLVKEADHPEAVAAIRCTLKDAERTIADEMSPWESVRAWWTGAAITRGWGSVHKADAGLVALEDEDAVRSVLPRLLTWMREVMEGDQRRRYECRLARYIDGKKLDRSGRIVVRQAYRDVIRANAEKYANVRGLRNGLWIATAALAAILVALAVWHANNTGFVSLCGQPVPVAEPPADAGAESRDDARQCLTGSDPEPSDVATVELVGAIGGLLMIAFGLGGANAPPSRYDPRLAQAALKAVAGAATGLIGVLLVQSELLIAPTSTSESLLLAYAAIFGFSQQLFTRFVDRRSGELLGSEETSETAAKV